MSGLPGLEATQRAMAGPEIPHNGAGVPIIPDDRFWLISGNRVERMEKRIAELEKLLREGIEGFGHVLVQTSDQAGVNDWRQRARKVLDHDAV